MLLFHDLLVDFEVILFGHSNKTLRYETHYDYYKYTGTYQEETPWNILSDKIH